MNWPVKNLNELCDINIGRTPSRSNIEYWKNGEHAWLSISDMTRAVDIIDTKEKISSAAINECNCKKIPVNTVLLSFKLSIGKVGINKIPLYTNEAIAALPIKKKDLLHDRFLFHALKNTNFSEGVDRAAKGLTLNKEKLKEIKIPLPPFAEQQRIAELLDTADRILRLRESAIAKLDELAQSVFVEMFGNKKIPSKSLMQLGKVKTGGTPPSSKDGMFGFSIPFMTPGDLENKSKPKRFLSEEGAAESVVVKKGSALVCCIGATIGKMSKAKTDCALNQQLNAVEWGDEINADFGIHALRQIKNKIINGGSATTLPIIKKSLFEKLEIIVPPYELQNKFCERITKIEELVDISDLELVKIRSLINSLQHQSFAVN